MSFDVNMNFNGMLPSTGGGGQFPVNTDEIPFHVCVIKSAEKKVNSNNTGEIAQFILEGVSPAVKGMTHKYSINLSHEKPDVVRRGHQDMFAITYAATGQQQLGNVQGLFGKPFGVVVKLDPSNKENENYTRIDHCVFQDGRELVINGALQPFTVQAGNFGAPQGNNGFGQTQQPQPQNNGFGQGQPQGQQQQPPQGFGSGAQVQPQGNFQPQNNNGGGVQQMTMPHPNAGQQQQDPNQGGYTGAPGGYQQQPQNQGQKPNWGQS